MRSIGFQFHIRVSQEITLELLQSYHAKEMFELTKKNKLFLKPWLNWICHIKSEKDSLKKIQSDQESFAKNTALELGIFRNKKLIGRIGFNWIKDIQAEIGYWLDESENGQGIVTESCRALIQHAFQETNLHRIIIRMYVENTRSQNVPERLGFTCEGVERESVLWKGEHRSSHVYSLLKTDLIHF